MRQTFLFLLIAALVAALVPASASAQEKAEERVKALENRVSQLENRDSRLEWALAHKEEMGGILFFYGIFCALWAQNTGRSAWAWFFLGLLFSVITVVVLLVKNAEDRKRQRRQDSIPSQAG
jgi:membrane protein implicated in regulation of membrane protease activity